MHLTHIILCISFLHAAQTSLETPHGRHYQRDVKRLNLSRLWLEVDCRNMEVSVSVYLVGGGLFCQAKNSPDLSWKRGQGLWLFGLWFHTSGDFRVVQGKR